MLRSAPWQRMVLALVLALGLAVATADRGWAASGSGGSGSNGSGGSGSGGGESGDDGGGDSSGSSGSSSGSSGSSGSGSSSGGSGSSGSGDSGDGASGGNGSGDGGKHGRKGRRNGRADQEEGRNQARREVSSGKAKSLGSIMGRLARDYPGEVVGVALNRKSMEYTVSVINNRGRLTRVRVNARTGAILGSGG